MPLICLLLAVLMLIPFNRPMLNMTGLERLIIGALAISGFIFYVRFETPERQALYLTLAFPLIILGLAPISTELSWDHILVLTICFSAVLIIPPYVLKRKDIITFKFWPDKFDWVDFFYTLSAIPLAWGAFRLYFGILSPEVPFNWVLPETPDTLEIFKLFMGINLVGIWDELFFVNICFAVLRALFPFKVANLAQSVIYMSVLYSMAFSGWGPLFVYTLALTQGAMYERSKALVWVLIVHLIVDYFLFQAIIGAYYPELSVWWH